MYDGLTIITRKGVTKTRFEHLGNELAKFSKHLRTLGEARVVTRRDFKKSKMQDKGLTCIFVVIQRIMMEVAIECTILLPAEFTL